MQFTRCQICLSEMLPLIKQEWICLDCLLFFNSKYQEAEQRMVTTRKFTYFAYRILPAGYSLQPVSSYKGNCHFPLFLFLPLCLLLLLSWLFWKLKIYVFIGTLYRFFYIHDSLMQSRYTFTLNFILVSAWNPYSCQPGLRSVRAGKLDLGNKE